MAEAVSGTLPFNPGASVSAAVPTVGIVGGTAGLWGLSDLVKSGSNAKLRTAGKLTATAALGAAYAGMFSDFLGDRPDSVGAGAGRGATAAAALGATGVVGTMIWNPSAFTTRASWGTALIAAGLGTAIGAASGAFMGRGGDETPGTTPGHEDGAACLV